VSLKKTDVSGSTDVSLKANSKVVYFTVEASNENVDANRQIVLMSTLRRSKDYFLTNGAISIDHRLWKRLPDNQTAVDGRYIIGAPVAVHFRGGSTWVTGKLYKENPMARIVIALLRQGSEKLKASIGGLSPQITTAPDGKQVVTSLKWIDLSLTLHPVNQTLEPARCVNKQKKLVFKTNKNREAQYE
jgi:hypothetical protein